MVMQGNLPFFEYNSRYFEYLSLSSGELAGCGRIGIPLESSVVLPLLRFPNIFGHIR